MSDSLATYSFLPWLRQGIANNILNGDNDNSVKLRASISVQLKTVATSISGANTTIDNEPKIINLYGPSDIIGIDSKAIVKSEPRNWITNFEPNYLPFIEFYEEDFPWRYTPASPEGTFDRLRPWLTLVVLKEDEFEDGQNMKDKPLPFFKMKSGKKPSEIFPKASELWAWAHVHVNADLSNGANVGEINANAVNAGITEIIKKNPDNAYSRIICPRKLEANVGYHAFLIPTFESGRLSGLGINLPADLVATKNSWELESNLEFPYYHRWYFRTGNVGDFEYLVNLLKPKPADKSIGVRDMDVLHVGSNLPPIDDVALKGILKLGGALRVPFDSLKSEDQLDVKKYDEWDENPYPHPFTKALAQKINLADDYVDNSKTVIDVNKDAGIVLDNNSGDPDPTITMPLYGRWHGLQQRLLKDNLQNDLPNNKNWIHELNLDPRFRVAAGIGTKVVQKGQEEYSQASWEQVGKVVEANNKLRLAQLALQVSSRLYQNHLVPLLAERAFILTAAIQKRVIYNNLTVHKNIEESVVPLATTSGTFRSVMRPRGNVMKKTVFNDNQVHSDNLIQRINEGKVVIAPPKQDPKGAINLSDLIETIRPKNIPDFIEKLLKKYTWFKYLPLILLVILWVIYWLFFIGIIGTALMGIVSVGLIWLYNKLNNWEKSIKNIEAISQNNQTPESIDEYPKSPNFVISEPSSGFIPSFGNSDSSESFRFKDALRDAFALINIKFPEIERKPLDFKAITATIIDAINPQLTIPQRTFDNIFIPERIKENMVENFTPVMVYPEIDVPMYKPLSEISSELFLPNINLIEQNSITLLENNQKFIEAYMVGINHEMSRELLWREFPTDQRGTYFRQFWDVSSVIAPQPETPSFKESLRDIPPIHRWHKTSNGKTPDRSELGQHNQRAMESGKTQLVLVIRGELLKKYPTAVIYAQKADWGIDLETKQKDVNEERIFMELTDTEKEKPPTEKIKMPLFEAKIEPDIYFFGFDLDDEEARGKLKPTSISDNSGWFFVIKERPGEPRFGLDIEKPSNGRLINWNNFSWEHIQTADGKCIEIDNSTHSSPSFIFSSFDEYNEAIDQENRLNIDDKQAGWSPRTNAAELAYILYQVPVLVGVHASRMLPK